MTRGWFLDEESRNRWIFYRVKKQILEKETNFQTVQILETYSLGKLLVLDGKIQSAALDEHIYHEALVHPAMTAHPCPERVLILGGGEGATLREVLKHGSVKRATMVDIDEQLVQICRKHLKQWHSGAFRDRRARIIFADAIEYVRSTSEKFDVILCDISDPEKGSPASLIYTKEFYGALKKRLRKTGLFVTQATEIFYKNKGIFPVIYRTAASVFNHADAYGEYIPSFSSLWGFVSGSQAISIGSLEPSLIRNRLKERGLKTRFYCPETHTRIFMLPPEIMEKIKREKSISTKRNPAFVYSPK